MKRSLILFRSFCCWRHAPFGSTSCASKAVLSALAVTGKRLITVF